MPKIIGIDPSSASTGFAIISGTINRGTKIEECGAIKLKGSMIERVGKLYDTLFEKLCCDVVCIALETPFLGKNIATYGKLSMLKGLIYLLADKFKLRVIELSPSKVKQLVTSTGAASKEDLANVLRKRYKDLPENLCNDITDAIGVAHAGLIELTYEGRYAKK